MEGPEVRYAKSGDVNIAYAVVGDGPFDVVFVNGWVLSSLEFAWEGPPADFFRRLSSFSRLILFDKRGTGLSDRTTGIPDLETRMDDIRAVMDAVGSKRAAIVGFSEGGPMTLLFAATYPQRTAATVLYGCGASYVWAEDYPWGDPREMGRGVPARRCTDRNPGVAGREAEVLAPEHGRRRSGEAVVAETGPDECEPRRGPGPATDEQQHRRSPHASRDPRSDPGASAHRRRTQRDR